VSLRCLVADDHPALVQAVSDFLHGADVEVVATASDGDHAVALAAETRPDVALVDFRMPRLAGVELVARLREAAPETRVVVYTADADEALVRGALGAGADAVLLKEAPLADLSRALATVAAGATYLDPALARFAVGAEVGTPMLTVREVSVLTLLAEGLTHDQIGERLSISGETVRTHVRKASDRLGASTRTEAVAKALRMGLIA
jgi:DNA-binding NarL/FixJ family response regulator